MGDELLIKEVETLVENHHTYHIPFDEFWETVGKSKIINKSLYYSRMFSRDHQFTVYLDSDNVDAYVKALSLKGVLQNLSLIKNDVVEITTIEIDEQK